jgi:virginiamycin B lyase
MAKVPLSAVDATANRLLCQWAGPGGDSLGIDHEALWLTDYHVGTVSRLDLQAVVEQCRTAPPAGRSG